MAARLGYQKLQTTGSVLDAVEAAVRSMELDPVFNAGKFFLIIDQSIDSIDFNRNLLNCFIKGYGSVLDINGVVEMDASIMNGSNLMAGCVTLVHDILHPVSLAKTVMLKTNITFLGGPSVTQFAHEQGIQILPPGSLVTEFAKKSLDEYKKDQAAGKTVSSVGEVGTVGAVAIDAYGNVAAATSTGGLTGKPPGRVGDSPILGAGNYADNVRKAVLYC